MLNNGVTRSQMAKFKIRKLDAVRIFLVLLIMCATMLFPKVLAERIRK